MSWSASGTATVRGEGAAGVSLEFTSPPQPQSGHGKAESERAIEASQDAAKALLASGAFGTGKFSVSLSGHANPDNKPTPGWSNEFVSISINQTGE